MDLDAALAKLEPWSALGMNISQRIWGEKKLKKATSLKLQATSGLTGAEGYCRISYYERNKL